MQTHEPREDFVTRLEATVLLEARRRARPMSALPDWLTMSRTRMALVTVAIVMVSMAAGGAVVAAAYRMEQNDRRDQIAATYERKLDVARLSLRTAQDVFAQAKRRVDIGVASPRDVWDEELKVVEAERDVKSLELQIEEIRLTGQQPVMTMSAPLVKGRDFVRQRWEIDIQAPEKALEIERARLRNAQLRVEIGVTDGAEVDAASARIAELSASIAAMKQKIEIRRRFVMREIDASQADLLGLDAEASARLLTLTSQLEAARKQRGRVSSLVQKGLADELEVAKANLRVLTLEADVAQAQLDRALISKRLKGKD